MSATVGELVVKRVHGRTVVERADPFVYIHTDLLEQLGATELADDQFRIGVIRYRVLGPATDCPGAMLCERVS